MILLRAIILFMGLGFFAGCETWHSTSACTEHRESALQDERAFAKIVAYYREAFPQVNFDEPPVARFKDGPDGERWHIRVPVGVDAEYQHPFARAFLVKQSENPDGLARMIASDLLLLRNEKLFTYSGRFGYNGEPLFDCSFYVVKIGPGE